MSFIDEVRMIPKELSDHIRLAKHQIKEAAKTSTNTYLIFSDEKIRSEVFQYLIREGFSCKLDRRQIFMPMLAYHETDGEKQLRIENSKSNVIDVDWS